MANQDFNNYICFIQSQYLCQSSTTAEPEATLPQTVYWGWSVTSNARESFSSRLTPWAELLKSAKGVCVDKLRQLQVYMQARMNLHEKKTPRKATWYGANWCCLKGLNWIFTGAYIHGLQNCAESWETYINVPQNIWSLIFQILGLIPTLYFLLLFFKLQNLQQLKFKSENYGDI